MDSNIKKEGRLGYNYHNDRYGILNRMDLWEDDGLHCGQGLEVLVGDKWIADRLEMKFDKTWYLVETKITGDDLEGLKVRIK
ncbi:MAG: DUF5348 domain-containing protein [bacterium]|nr:DUF5348 domain-containing protein [bacterium]